MRDLFDKRVKKQTLEKQVIFNSPADSGVKRGEVYTKKYVQKSYSNPSMVVRLTYDVLKEGSGKNYFLEGIATDSEDDLMGDNFTSDALMALNNQLNGGSIPLCFNHHKNVRLGKFVGSTLKDGKLLVRAKLDDVHDNPDVASFLELMDKGSSFGFSVAGYTWSKPKPSESGREFKHMALNEVSLVIHPANPRAEVTALIRKYLNQSQGR